MNSYNGLRRSILYLDQIEGIILAREREMAKSCWAAGQSSDWKTLEGCLSVYLLALPCDQTVTDFPQIVCKSSVSGRAKKLRSNSCSCCYSCRFLLILLPLFWNPVSLDHRLRLRLKKLGDGLCCSWIQVNWKRGEELWLKLIWSWCWCWLLWGGISWTRGSSAPLVQANSAPPIWRKREREREPRRGRFGGSATTPLLKFSHMLVREAGKC